MLLDREASSSQAEAGILHCFLLLFFYRSFDFIRSFLKFPDQEQIRSCPSWPLPKKSHAHERDFSGCSGRSPCIPVQAQDPKTHHLYVFSEMVCTPPRQRNPTDRTRHRGPRGQKQMEETLLTYLTTGSGMASALAGTWTPFSHSCLQGSART